MRAVLRLILGLSLIVARPAFAWGPEGHQIIAHIAAHALTPTAKAKVGMLLGGDTEAMMVLDSTWADEVRADRPDTAAWHFVNIELGSPGYDAARDCRRGDCVVAQIERDVKILRSSAPAPVRAEALRFLIHFVGDIEQPLHAADDHDKGGNMVPVIMGGERTSLHRIWDNDVVTALGHDPAGIARGIDASLGPAQRVAWSGGTPAAWATESFLVAERRIYERLPRGEPVELPDNYAASQRGIVREQLAKAGLRLAALLNAALR